MSRGWRTRMRVQATRKNLERSDGLALATGASAGRRYAPPELRASILLRDRYRCRYCRVKVTDATANIDHVVAVPEGLTVRLNLVTSCRPCNQAKGSSIYVIPIALPGDRFYVLQQPSPKPRETEQSRRPRHISARIHSRPIRDPWIREGPLRGRT